MFKYILTIFIVSAISIMPQMLGPKVGVQQLAHDFGDVNEGDIVKHLYVISNNGGDLLKILDVRASCGCTAAKPEKSELKPGESTNVLVSFNSKGRKGPQNKTVTVVTNDPDMPNVLLTFKCNVVVNKKVENKFGAIIFLPETQHDFGKVKAGTKVEYIFKFENKGTESLLIKDVKTSCGCTAAVVSNNSIKPGEVGSIKVDFDTKNREGRNSKSITIVSNDYKEPNKVITIYADVQKN
ncbi:MAG TPA: DUF1573 domain-containing protein [Ignavibacteriaceae bacterium]|nr:DUF1573 domain-containing protein [Ignavibacteriaceae bacterium]